MAKNIYYINNDKLSPNLTTGHKGTPIRTIDEFEGSAACVYQIEYLKMWRTFFNKHSYTQNWFEQVPVLRRQSGFYKNKQKYYTCQEVFQDCEDICNQYLQNSTRYKHIAVPCFDKVERAVEKGIEIVKKHEFPYTDKTDQLETAQTTLHIKWIRGSRPKNAVFDRLFDLEKTAEQQLA